MWFDPAQLTKTRPCPPATVATSATFPSAKRVEAARVARIAKVASPPELRSDAPSRSWRIHYPAGELAEVACLPDATHAEILEWHPDAVAAEPFEPMRRQPTAALTADEQTAIGIWLTHIEETDPAIIGEVLNQCRTDADAREYFLEQAEALRRPAAVDDDRRRCDQCANLTAGGLCLAARRGEIVANRNYEPVRDLPRRCEGYAPRPDDPDRRPGRERWPELIREEE